MSGVLISWVLFPFLIVTYIFCWLLTNDANDAKSLIYYVSKWVEAIASRTTDARVVLKFLHKDIFFLDLVLYEQLLVMMDHITIINCLCYVI